MLPTFLRYTRAPTIDECQEYLRNCHEPLIFFQFGYEQKIIDFHLISEDDVDMLKSLNNSFFSYFINKEVDCDIELGLTGINLEGELIFNIIPTYDSLSNRPSCLPSLLGLTTLHWIYQQRQLGIAKKLVKKRLSDVEHEYQTWSNVPMVAKFHFYHYLRVNTEVLGLRHPGYNIYNFSLIGDNRIVYTEHRTSISVELSWIDGQIEFLLQTIKTALDGLPA